MTDLFWERAIRELEDSVCQLMGSDILMQQSKTPDKAGHVRVLRRYGKARDTLKAGFAGLEERINRLEKGKEDMSPGEIRLPTAQGPAFADARLRRELDYWQKQCLKRTADYDRMTEERDRLREDVDARDEIISSLREQVAALEHMCERPVDPWEEMERAIADYEELYATPAGVLEIFEALHKTMFAGPRC